MISHNMWSLLCLFFVWNKHLISRRPIAPLIGGSDAKSDEKSGSGRTCNCVGKK